MLYDITYVKSWKNKNKNGQAYWTIAAGMKEQVQESVKAERSNRLLEMEKEHSRSYREKYINQVLEVLFEEVKSINGRDYQIGHTTRYVKVAKLIEESDASTVEDISNCLIEGRIKGFLNDEILLME